MLVVLALALVPVLFIGGCLVVALGLVVYDYREYASEKAAAASDPRLQQPLVSTAGRILFKAQHDAIDDFYIVNVDGSGLTRLTTHPRGFIYSAPPIVSPDGTRLAMISDGQVLIRRLDRPGVTTRLDRPGGSLAWSPDGERLASLRIDDQQRLYLYLFNADGAGDVRDIAQAWPSTAVTRHEQSVSDLVWSPDEKRFAFILHTRPRPKSLGVRHNHLYIATADGRLKNISVEANQVPVERALAWSPDGRRLAFAGGRGIGIVDVDLKWTDSPAEFHETRASQRPAWSPDGTRLAWFSRDSIVVGDADTENQQELAKGLCRGFHPAWSQDGKRLALVCNSSWGQLNIFAMNADGTGLRQVTRFGDEAWSRAAASAFLSPEYPVWLPAISATSHAP